MSGSESRLVGVPVNTAVVQGSAVTLQCSSDVSGSRIFWYDSLCVSSISFDCGPNDLIYNPSYGLASSVDSRRFRVTSVNDGAYVLRDLNINPVQPTDAGVYLCVEIVGAQVTSVGSAQLIILGMTITYRSSKHITVNNN